MLSKTNKQKCSKKEALFYICANLFNDWLNRDSWTLLSASAFCLLDYHIWGSLWASPLDMLRQ